MCGIAGIVDKRLSTDVLHEQAASMNAVLAHRGPDSEGLWSPATGGLVLAHRRLSIQDLSAHGNQPMLSSDARYSVVFNGEIYNFKEIAAELEVAGHRFNGGSDTEVLLAAILQWGIGSAVRRFIGMFAFALWDEQEKVLTLCRDRLGEKPLYYGWLGSTFYFASELKAIEQVVAKDQLSIDHAALGDFLKNGYISAPLSIYKHINKLMPGTLLTLPQAAFDGQSRPAPEAYWSVLDSANAGLADQIEDEQQATDALDGLLKNTIKRQMIADVDVGMFLSGGIDSSVVCAVAQAESAKQVKTYTIGFSEKEYDESAYAQQIARHLGTEHCAMTVTPQDVLQVVPELSTIYDEPFADSSQTLAYLVSSMAKQHVTVCLSGDGGDELFAGYNRYIWNEVIWQKMSRMPISLRKLIGKLLAVPSPRLIDWLYQNIIAFSRGSSDTQKLVGLKLQKLAGLMQQDNVDAGYDYLLSYWHQPQQLITQPFTKNPSVSELAYPDTGNFIERAMYLDQNQYLPGDNLAKVDRASMATSLETRLPLLSHEIVDFSWRVPLDMKVRNKQSKWLLRQVLYRYVPPELIERPKMGFSVPVDQWLKGELREWAGDLIASADSLGRGLLETQPVNRAWDEHIKGKRDHSHRLWTVLMYLSWSAEHA